MVGCIGDDMLGKQILENLKHNHVNVEYVKSKRTFRYCTHYTSDNDNSIIVVPSEIIKSQSLW